MSTVPTTPRQKTTFNLSTPTNTRVAGTHVQSSPHYATTRRHSLYGAEDRVVIDPGSRIWKVGFSGEGRPRDVFSTGATSSSPLWSLSRAIDPGERAEEDKMLELRLEKYLRSVFHESLLTDPKLRKVILVEHPLLPLYIKEIIARILFDNLQVPSISFASNHLLSLIAVGRITGLVLDCGHLESIALPIFAARPLFPHLRTTPLAGSRLTSHLRALILLFGTYLPPPTSLSAAANIPAANRSTRVPEEVLTDNVIEEIKTRCCFVGEALESSPDMRVMSPSGDNSLEMDIPPSSDATHSESEFSHFSGGGESNFSSHQASSEFSVVSHSRSSYTGHPGGERHLQALATMYTRHSTATNLHMRVVPPLSQQNGTGLGTLIIPGWIRERASEVLFEGGDVDESSVAEVILDALLKVPMDLRKTLASSILVVGGTPMIPGFIPRLHVELLKAITPPATQTRHLSRPNRQPAPPYDRYATLRPLTSHFTILNNPSPYISGGANTNAGKAPAFSPATMAWVGGSLAGSLKTGGAEVTHEKWDEAGRSSQDLDDNIMVDLSDDDRLVKNVLPDWTRMPLPVGAPSAVATPAIAHRTPVGA